MAEQHLSKGTVLAVERDTHAARKGCRARSTNATHVLIPTTTEPGVVTRARQWPERRRNRPRKGMSKTKRHSDGRSLTRRPKTKIATIRSTVRVTERADVGCAVALRDVVSWSRDNGRQGRRHRGVGDELGSGATAEFMERASTERRKLGEHQGRGWTSLSPKGKFRNEARHHQRL